LNRPARYFLTTLLVLMCAALGWAGYSYLAATPKGQTFGAPFSLVAQDGSEITEKAFQGHPTMVFFGFTHCPEVCPTTLFEMSGWFKTLGSEGGNIKAYFVSVDPERDTPELLKAYVSNVTDRVIGVSGEPDKIAAMIKSFGVYARKVPTDGGSYTMDHTASVFLLNSAGDFHGTIAYGENADTAVEKLRRLAKL
jgi:protein SCO1